MGDVAKEIKKLHPPMKSLRDSTKFSVNFVLAGESSTLKDGDEVGVLPPVAGG